MSSRRDRLRASIFILFAVAAPWDVFLFVPGFDMRLSWMLALAIVALEFVDYVYTRRLGVRLELLWPAFVLLVLALPLIRIVPAEGAVAILLGLAAARSVGPLLARDVVTALAFSIGILALYTLLFFVLQLAAPAWSPAPVAYSVKTGVVAPFGHTLTGCVVLLVVGSAASGSRFLRSNSESATRWGLLVACWAALVTLTVLLTASLNSLAAWRPPDYFASVGIMIPALFGGWLLARTLAKSYIHWRELRHTISEELTNILAVLAVLALLFPMQLRMLWGLLVGVAAGAAQAERDLAPPPRKWVYALVPVALLVVANWGGVHFDDAKHPRNYDVAARRDFANEDYARLESRLDYFETYWPEERRTHLWRARIALERGLLHETAYEISLACRPAEDVELLLPPPTPDEIDALLIRMRDACSQSDSKAASLAHIQALLGAGEFSHAEAVMQQALIKAESVMLPEGLDEDLETEAYGCPCSWPLRAAVMETVWPAGSQKPAELEALLTEDSPGAKWLRLLTSWGGELREAPARFSREKLPLVCIAECHRASVELACILDGALLARTEELVDTPMIYTPETRYDAFDLGPDGQALWTYPETQSSGEWHVTLNVEGAAVAKAEFQDGIALHSIPPSEPLPAPDVPTISIWF